MRPRVIVKYIGMVLLLGAAGMLVSAGVSLVEGVTRSFWGLLASAGITALVGGVPAFVFPKEKQIGNKEGYCIVVGAWLLSCVAGMLPYLFWGAPFTVANAWFEAVSGFTTTGASIIPDVEALPDGLLFWRSITHWIGGAGVVMFAMLIMPILGRSRLMVASVELSASARDDYKYTSGKIVRILLGVYLGLSVACFLALWASGMGWFDALNHTMSTVATGGFSTKNTSIAHWDSPLIEGVITFFMLVAGLHFGVIFATFTGRRNNVFRSEVVRFYVIGLAAATVAVALNLRLGGVYPQLGTALRMASFEVVTFATTTGFALTDVTLWGPFAVVVLMWMGVQCACAGSTAGGIKADRIWLAAKVIRHQIRQQQHPNAIIRTKLGGVVQEASTLSFVMLFIVAYLLLLGLGTMVVSLWGHDLVSAASMSMLFLGNVGAGMGDAGGFTCFDQYPVALKSFFSLQMLLGRLEIFGLIQLFLLKWWR